MQLHRRVRKEPTTATPKNAAILLERFCKIANHKKITRIQADLCDGPETTTCRTACRFAEKENRILCNLANQWQGTRNKRDHNFSSVKKPPLSISKWKSFFFALLQKLECRDNLCHGSVINRPVAKKPRQVPRDRREVREQAADFLEQYYASIDKWVRAFLCGFLVAPCWCKERLNLSLCDVVQKMFLTFTFLCIFGCFMPSWVLKFFFTSNFFHLKFFFTQFFFNEL